MRHTHATVANDLANKIGEGIYRPGEQLPSVRELMRLYGIHFSGADKALQELERRGVIIRRKSVGSFVKPADEEEPQAASPVAVVLQAMGEKLLDERYRSDLGRRVLAIKMQPNDADAETIKDYLLALLQNLWTLGDRFNSERPFGKSAWEFDVYEALVRAFFIQGVIEDGDYLGEFDRAAGDELMKLAIEALGEH